MHHITLVDGSTRQSRTIYALRAFAYGAIAMTSLPLVMSDSLTGPMDFLWPIFIGFGGLCALAGSVSLRWFGEFIGLPLIAAGLAALAVISYGLETERGSPWVGRANFLLLISFALALVIRWRAVLSVYRIAMYFRRGRGD